VWSPRARATAARTIFLVVAVGLLAWAVATRWSSIVAALHRLHPWTVGLTLLGCIAGVALSLVGWRVLVADLAGPIPLRTAGRIFFLAQLGKYVPGGVWQFLAVMALGAEHDLPSHATLLASSVLTVLSLLAALVIAAVTLPALAHDASATWWPLLLALPVVAVLVHPRVVNPVVDLALRVTRRGRLDRPLSTRAVVQALGWTFLSLLVLGAAAWVLVADLGHPGGTAYIATTGAFSLAWAAGLAVVFVPAGAGVREGVVALALTPVVSRPGALLVALMMRAATALADVVLAATAALLQRIRRSA
jgi:glycosyltransferase 2 family protein